MSVWQKLCDAFDVSYSGEDERNIAHELEHIYANWPEGRIPGSMDDHMLLYLMRKKACLQSGVNDSVHVEIGSLFGASAVISSLAFSSSGAGNQILIDPLSGYYGEETDPFSGSRVSEKVLRSNLAAFKVEQYRLVASYSDSAEALAAVNSNKIASLFIDGDHSFVGVAKDWENYCHKLAIEGYVLLDNYNDPNWPEVTIFVKYLESKINEWEKICAIGNGVVFKRIGVVSSPLLFEIGEIDEILSVKEKQLNSSAKLASTRLEGIDSREAQIAKLKVQIKNRGSIIDRLKSQIDQFKSRMWTRDEVITQFKSNREKDKSKISNRDAAIASLKGRRAQQERMISNRDAAIASLKGRRAQQERMISNRDAAIASLKGRRAQQERMISNRDAAIASLKGRRAQQERMISNRDAAIASLKGNKVKLEIKLQNRDHFIYIAKQERVKYETKIANRDKLIKNLKQELEKRKRKSRD